MNKSNVIHFFSTQFKKDSIQKDSIYYDSEELEHNIQYFIKDSFIEYLENLLESSDFYSFCQEHLQKKNICNHDRFLQIVSEIRNDENTTDYDENDLEDCDFVFNWYLKNRTFYILYEDIDIFLDLVA
jgi:hypothetical protein